MHVSISLCLFFEAINISLIIDIFVTKYSLSAGFQQQGSRLDFESSVKFVTGDPFSQIGNPFSIYIVSFNCWVEFHLLGLGS